MKSITDHPSVGESEELTEIGDRYHAALRQSENETYRAVMDRVLEQHLVDARVQIEDAIAETFLNGAVTLRIKMIDGKLKVERIVPPEEMR